MKAQRKTCRSASVALVVLLCAVPLFGCGGTGHASTVASSSASTTASTTKTVNRGARPEPAGDVVTPKNAVITKHDRASCEQAVQSAPALAAAAKPEIAELCFRINYVREDNERTVRAVCQEVANASSLSSEAARQRTVSACYVAGMK
jgi:hypothetical protein